MMDKILELITLENIVGIVVLFGFLFSVYQYKQSKKILRPSMPAAQYISDAYGRRLLFTVISNNPKGSEILKKQLKVEKVPRRKFKRKNIIYLNFIPNKVFLNSSIHFDSIPNWLIKGQESFVAILADNHLTEEGTYKLTFHTSDGSCSNTLSGYFGLLSR